MSAAAGTLLLDDALRALAAGLCVLPPREDGSKQPIGATWGEWQSKRPSTDQVGAWYANGRSGIGYVTGAVSGQLEVLDFDEYAVFEEYRELAQASGLGPLLHKLMTSYFERSPRGAHLFYRCPEIAGNTKLAQRPRRPDETSDSHDKWKTLIETRGEGGYIVAAPSHGRVHPAGGRYELVSGGVETIPTITLDERTELLVLARALDQHPKPPADEPAFGCIGQDGERPGDVYNRRARWNEVLEPDGWRRVLERGGVTYWRRPGKDRGTSATTNYAGSDLLYCFSTSTCFDAERSYSKFAAYTVLNHGGDFAAAARALTHQHRGDPQHVSVVVSDTDEVVAPFPLETLPRALRDLVEAGAASVVVPPDFIAVPLLIEAGALIGNALELEIKPGWTEGANLYGGCVGDPGSKKAPALKLASAPLRRIQQRLAREYTEACEEYKLALAEWEAKKKSERGPKPEPPVYRHVLTTDATVEALAPILCDNKSIVLIKDELVAWIRAMDAYRSGRGGDREHYLSWWSRMADKVDRETAPPIWVPHPFLAVYGTIQPDLLPELADAARREDGFVDRLLLAFPDPLPDHFTEIGVDPMHIDAVEMVFERLYSLSAREDEDGDAQPHVVRFSQEAAVLWKEWYESYVADRDSEAFPQRLRGSWAKFPSQLARLALILHALQELDPMTAQLSADTLATAMDLLDYFASHLRKVYRYLGQQQRGMAVKLMQALKEGGEMLQRDIVHEVFHGHGGARVRATLEELEEAVLRRRIDENTGGRHGTYWTLA